MNDLPLTSKQEKRRATNLAAAGVSSSVTNRKVFRVLTDAIEAQFDTADWQRLADELDGRAAGAIENHPRLLRALHWNDHDYPEHVRIVVEQILGPELDSLDVLADAAALENWLQGYDTRNKWLLEAAGGVELSQAIGSSLTTGGVKHELRKLQMLSVHDDPHRVIGSAKNAIEATAKCVLHGTGSESMPKKFPQLVAAAFDALDLTPKEPPGPDATAQAARKLLQSLLNAAQAIGEARNGAGDGHGELEIIPADELIEIADLVKDTAVMLSNLLIHALGRRTGDHDNT